MDHPSLGVGIGGERLMVAFDVSDAVANSGDCEEADCVGPAEAADLSGLGGMIALWCIFSSFTDAFVPSVRGRGIQD